MRDQERALGPQIYFLRNTWDLFYFRGEVPLPNVTQLDSKPPISNSENSSNPWLMSYIYWMLQMEAEINDSIFNYYYSILYAVRT